MGEGRLGVLLVRLITLVLITLCVVREVVGVAVVVSVGGSGVVVVGKRRVVVILALVLAIPLLT